MAIIEPLRDLSLIEEHGEYVAGQRVVYVGVSGVSSNEEVLTTALDDEGVPQSNESYSSEFPRLVVTRRSPAVVGNVNGIHRVKILVEYQLEPATSIAYPSRGVGSLSQLTTNKDKNGEPVVLSYGEQRYLGEFSVFAAEGSQYRRCIEETNDPEYTKSSWLNKINSDEFDGAPSGHWLVSHVGYELWNARTDPNRWVFDYELSRSTSPDGWTYWAAWHDARGNIPSGAAFVECPWHDAVPFSEKFPPASGGVA